MLDIKFIRENPEVVQKGSLDKGFDVDVNKLLEVDRLYRKLSVNVQKLREERNKAAYDKNIEKGKEIKEKLEKEEKKLKELESQLNELLLQVPNIPKSDVKVGEDESANEIIKKHGEPKDFSAYGGPADGWEPKDHLELGESLDLIDIERAAKVSGTRFSYLKSDLVLLEFALIQFAFEILVKEGFTPIIPPVLIKTDVMKALGYMEYGGDEDMFILPKDDLVLIGTAEHSIVSMHKDEIFNKKEMPKRYVGFSTCFRREAGSYGKDTRGIFRVHQFDKVEMVSFVAEENDDQEHEYLLSLQEKLFQSLKIPYQVVKMCIGDLGFPVARKYDLEAWIPSQKKYREVTSTSTTTDFQARRLNIRYQDGNEKKYAHILNGTAFAIGRTLVSIMENYQQKDGSILIPKVLQKYLNKTSINP